MNEIYLHIWCAHGRLYCRAPVWCRPPGEETVEQIAQIRADVGYQFVLFIQMMSSVGSIVRIYEGRIRFIGC